MAHLKDKDNSYSSKYSDEGDVYIAKDHIISLTPSKYGNHYITLIDGSYGIIKTSIEEVLKMLEE